MNVRALPELPSHLRLVMGDGLVYIMGVRTTRSIWAVPAWTSTATMWGRILSISSDRRGGAGGWGGFSYSI
jgi:hypothetical protein